MSHSTEFVQRHTFTGLRGLIADVEGGESLLCLLLLETQWLQAAATKRRCRQNQSVDDAQGVLPAHWQTWVCNLGNWLTLILFCHWAWGKMVAGLADAGLQTSAPTSPFTFPNAASRSQSGESWLKWTAGSEAVVERTIPSKRELAGLLIYVLWSSSEKQNKFFYLWL